MTVDTCHALIQQRLTHALNPTLLKIVDESHLHIGHPGAKNGRHFAITIACAQFAGKTSVACHRLVYAALGDLVGKEIHAARIVCIT